MHPTLRFLARFGTLVAAFAYAAPALADEGRHGLIRDAEFTARYAAEVEPHWTAHVVAGRFQTTDGLALRYAKLVRPDARGSVVVSNGRTESYLKYKEIAYDLWRAGYSVYLLDHRGQGLSPRLLPDPDDHDKGHVERFEDYVVDLHTFVAQVVRADTPGRLYLLAHSMGGGIAARYLQTHPDTFVAAVLSSPMIEPDAKILLSVESSCAWFRATAWLCPTCYAGFVSRPYRHTPQTLDAFTHSEARWAAVLQVFEEAPQARLGGPTRRWAAEACAVSERILQHTAQVRTPLLLLQAGDDSAVTPQAQDEFCRRLQAGTGGTCHGPDGGPLRIEGARHELFIESDAYRLPALTAALDFFARH